jgi:ABC-type sulfate transport system substrate-binding protein
MITEYVEKIMRNGINNFSQELNKSPQEVQILIFWDAEEEKPKYKKMVQGEKSEVVTFNQILNVRFDMMNREAICGNFITGTLQRYSKELSCEMSNLFVVIYLVDDEEKDVRLWLYKNSDAIKEIELEEILSS